MKKIAVFSSGRWDYGHLYWVMKGIETSDKLELTVLVPANHHNIDELRKEFKVKTLLPISSVDEYGFFYSNCVLVLKELRSDMLVVLGDRFETHAMATAAFLTNTRISHLHGGEKNNSGSFDDELRNSITMMADIHFTSNEEYAFKLMELFHILHGKYGYEYFYDSNYMLGGYELIRSEGWIVSKNQTLTYERYFKDGHIFNVGAPGLDWLTHATLYSNDINKPYILACFHPVTKELVNTEDQMCKFLNALVSCEETVVLIRPNIDPYNNTINHIIDDYDKQELLKNWYIESNFDPQLYLSLMQYSEMIVGNSSSGIIEAAR
jgi:UDP-N-acetylglucosamine 2-epimerase